MPFGPGLLISTTCAAGYVYWRFSFHRVPAALDLERAGRLDEARALLQGFLESRNPLTYRGGAKARCRLLLARLERKAGRYDAAVLEADRLLDTHSSPGMKLAGMQVKADSLAWAGDLDSAYRTAERALEQAQQAGLAPFVTEIRGLMARILTWQGQFEAARDIAGHLMKSEGAGQRLALLRMAEIDRAAGRFTDAAEWCRQLVEITADPAPRARGQAPPELWRALAHYHAARSAWLGGDLELAGEWLDFPLADRLPRAEQVGWWGLQAVTAASRGDRTASRNHLKAMQTLRQNAPPGYGALAMAAYWQAQIDMLESRDQQAAEGFAEALRNQPPGDLLPELYYWLGICLDGGGKQGAGGAYACGSRQPETFHFAKLCREKAARSLPDSLMIPDSNTNQLEIR